MTLDIILKALPPTIYLFSCVVQYWCIKRQIRLRRDAEDQVKFISKEFQRSSVELKKANEEISRLRHLLMANYGASQN